MSKLGEKEGHALRPDAQAFDEVRIVTVPRFKESELSGDEWRISATVQFYRKGVLKHTEGARNVEMACNFAAYFYAHACDEGHAYFAGDGTTCDQEGCAEPATVHYRLKKRYCREGHASEPLRVSILRHFCEKHRERGDCALEDADENYEAVEWTP